MDRDLEPLQELLGAILVSSRDFLNQRRGDSLELHRELSREALLRLSHQLLLGRSGRRGLPDRLQRRPKHRLHLRRRGSQVHVRISPKFQGLAVRVFYFCGRFGFGIFDLLVERLLPRPLPKKVRDCSSYFPLLCVFYPILFLQDKVSQA